MHLTVFRMKSDQANTQWKINFSKAMPGLGTSKYMIVLSCCYSVLPFPVGLWCHCFFYAKVPIEVIISLCCSDRPVDYLTGLRTPFSFLRSLRSLRFALPTHLASFRLHQDIPTHPFNEIEIRNRK